MTRSLLRSIKENNDMVSNEFKNLTQRLVEFSTKIEENQKQRNEFESRISKDIAQFRSDIREAQKDLLAQAQMSTEAAKAAMLSHMSGQRRGAPFDAESIQ